jgi:hypothetical protein
MSMIEDLTKEMQAHRDEHKIQMDQIKGVSTNVPTDNKFEIYTNKYLMDNVKGVNHGSQIILFLVILSFNIDMLTYMMSTLLLLSLC